MKPIKKPCIVLSFFMNYALFMVCSFMQLHLVVNWLLIFVLLLIEILCFFRCPLSDSFVLALISMIIGLALNILFRCLLAAIFDLPLTSFSNDTQAAGNLKRYPVGLAFWPPGCISILDGAGRPTSTTPGSSSRIRPANISD